LVIEAQCSEGLFFPSNVMAIVQIGRPILALSPKLGTLSDILSEHGGGIASDNCSIDAVSTALRMLYQAWENGDLKNRYGSSHLMSSFSEDIVLGKLFEAIEMAEKGASHE